MLCVGCLWVFGPISLSTIGCRDESSFLLLLVHTREGAAGGGGGRGGRHANFAGVFGCPHVGWAGSRAAVNGGSHVQCKYVKTKESTEMKHVQLAVLASKRVISLSPSLFLFSFAVLFLCLLSRSLACLNSSTEQVGQSVVVLGTYVKFPK